MEIIKGVTNLKVYDNTLFHLEDIEKAYTTYLDKLLKSGLSPKTIGLLLHVLKNRELLNTQQAEQENSFLISIYQMSQRKNSIDTMVKYLHGKDRLTSKQFQELHKMTIEGTSDDIKENYPYRTDNEKWVGSYGTKGSRNIDYMPPDYNDIPELADYILEFLSNDSTNLFDNVFIKPFAAHALIAYLQPFGNGNTRVARLLQHGYIWKESMEKYNLKLESPALFLSENYLMTRQYYRALLKNIAVEKDNDAWNKWFNYNLNMVDEQLYKITNDLDEYVRKNSK